MTILASLNNLRASIRAALDSLENSKLSKSDYTAQDVFAKVKTLHGPGSGLDADTLDGKAAADFAQSVHGHSVADVQGLQTILDGKVDAVAGFGLSQQNFSQSEKDKLARMDDTQRWKGEFQTLAALQAAWPTAEPGSYAHVDGGPSQDAQKYIYDTTDQKWVLATSKADPLTPAQVKQLYEANADTFAFSSSHKTKLDGVAEGANKYVHPANHPASIITQDANNRFVTDAEKAEWSGKAAGSHGHGAATTTAAGFMSAADKTKLDGVAEGATANTGTVTSVQVAVPTGLQVSGGPVTTSGTLTITLQSGYSLPTTAKQNNWDTAYGWGNHASAGYSKTDTKYTAGSGLTLTGTEFSLPVATSGTGTFVTGVTQTASGLQVTLGTPPNTTYAAMTQAEAEAGTDTNGRLISALRVRQAVAAWWTGVNVPVEKVSGLGTASTKSTGTAAGNVMLVGAFGLGTSVPATMTANAANNALPGSFTGATETTEENAVLAGFPALGGVSTTPRAWTLLTQGSSARLTQIATEVFGQGTVKGRVFTRVKHDSNWTAWQEVYTSQSFASNGLDCGEL